MALQIHSYNKEKERRGRREKGREEETEGRRKGEDCIRN